MLQRKVSQLESECEIVKWYLAILERGVDTKEVVKEFAKLRIAHDKLIKQTTAEIKKITEQNTKLKNKNEKLLHNLNRQQENVVKPLIAQVQK